MSNFGDHYLSPTPPIFLSLVSDVLVRFLMVHVVPLALPVFMLEVVARTKDGYPHTLVNVDATVVLWEPIAVICTGNHIGSSHRQQQWRLVPTTTMVTHVCIGDNNTSWNALFFECRLWHRNIIAQILIKRVERKNLRESLGKTER